jgi:hypothetical protein
MAEVTARFGIPLLISGQGQKDITHNEALVVVDAIVGATVEARTLGTAPVNPQEGACWLVADGAIGNWAGKSGNLAIWSAGGWRFLLPPEGMSLYIKAEGVIARKVGTAWRDEAPRAAPAARVVPPAGGTVQDLESRAAISTLIARLSQLGLLAP